MLLVWTSAHTLGTIGLLLFTAFLVLLWSLVVLLEDVFEYVKVVVGISEAEEDEES